MAYFESDFWHPSVATDVVLFTLRKGELHILCVKRKDDGLWALPGGFLQQGESLDECALRELKEETGVTAPYIEHFKNYSDPQRDHRQQTISVAYMAIQPSDELQLRADTDVSDVKWFPISGTPQLAFDHNQICKDAHLQVGYLVESKPNLVFAFHEGSFTLTELQQTFAALAGDKYAPHNKRNFRQWVDKYEGVGLVEETGNMKTGTHRPAKLYRPNQKLFGASNV